MALRGVVADANAALDRGEWKAAKAGFETALGEEQTPEALDGLGQALWWLNNLHAGIELRERAYAGYKALGMRAPAGRVATWLGGEYFTVHGNLAAAGGWIQRADTLLADLAPCAEQGWLLVMKAAMSMDPAAVQDLAAQAMALGRSLEDGDLEIVGLSALGLGLVGEGRIADGMARLDEAMAAATGGELSSLWAVSDVYCNTLLACERAGDFERAEQWCSVVMEFARRRACQPMFPFCHVTFGSILTASGRWGEAEVELELAVRTFDTGHRAMRVLALARLAELRVRQGRIPEAEELLNGYEEHPLAVRAIARLSLALGDPVTAVSVLRRRLAQVGRNTLLAFPLLTLLTDAFLQQGDIGEAANAADQMAHLEKTSGQQLMGAEATMARAKVALAAGEPSAADGFDRAVAAFLSLELPWEAAQARLGLARAAEASQPEMARAEARLALAAFERLGAARLADQAARLLRDLGAGTAPGPRSGGGLTSREAEVLELVGLGLSNAEIAERLFISPRTVEHHVGSMLGKLTLKTRPQLVAHALRRPPPAVPPTAVPLPGSGQK
ncbi:MAG TPA: LuxR C-terminal-related transcriptional regulator [Actinomycetota bacterium]|nr:LuxR C-terminal-related transcriptional regulator [Actinomycetota bacterium]